MDCKQFTVSSTLVSIRHARPRTTPSRTSGRDARRASSDKGGAPGETSRTGRAEGLGTRRHSRTQRSGVDPPRKSSLSACPAPPTPHPPRGTTSSAQYNPCPTSTARRATGTTRPWEGPCQVRHRFRPVSPPFGTPGPSHGSLEWRWTPPFRKRLGTRLPSTPSGGRLGPLTVPPLPRTGP